METNQTSRLDPPGLRAVGNLLGSLRDPLVVVAREAGRHPDMSLLLQWPFRLYLVTHPDYVKDVLVTHSEELALGRVRRWMKLALGQGLLTSEGGFHLRPRRAIQPGFHRQRIRAYGDTMVLYASEHAARWRDGEVIDAAAEMRELTLRIVLRTLFGSQLPPAVEDVRQATNTIEEYLSARARSPLGDAAGGPRRRDRRSHVPTAGEGRGRHPHRRRPRDYRPRNGVDLLPSLAKPRSRGEAPRGGGRGPGGEAAGNGRSAASRAYGAGADRGDAAVPTLVGQPEEGQERGANRRDTRFPVERTSWYPSTRPIATGAGFPTRMLSSRTGGPRSSSIPAALRLFPLRRRAQAVRRRALRRGTRLKGLI